MRITNKDLLFEIVDGQQNGNQPTERLVDMWTDMIDKFTKRAQFAPYSTDDDNTQDMKQYAMEILFKHSFKLDPAKSTNAFAWTTELIHSAFIQHITSERKENKIKEDYKQLLEIQDDSTI